MYVCSWPDPTHKYDVQYDMWRYGSNYVNTCLCYRLRRFDIFINKLLDFMASFIDFHMISGLISFSFCPLAYCMWQEVYSGCTVCLTLYCPTAQVPLTGIYNNIKYCSQQQRHFPYHTLVYFCAITANTFVQYVCVRVQWYYYIISTSTSTVYRQTRATVMIATAVNHRPKSLKTKSPDRIINTDRACCDRKFPVIARQIDHDHDLSHHDHRFFDSDDVQSSMYM